MATLRRALITAGLLFLSAALLFSARAAVGPVLPETKYETPKAAPKTKRDTPPCMAGDVKIIGVWVIRDQSGRIVAVGQLRRRC